MHHAVERYRLAEEQLLYSAVGTLPAERTVDLPRARARVRLLEYGRGPLLLFIHGGPNAASTWLPLVRRLPDFRCVLLERPGCGLSEPARPLPRRVRPWVVDLVADTLAALDTRSQAIVASSFGSFCALAYAVAQPALVARMIHFGAPALVPGGSVPLPFLLRSVPVVGELLRRLDRPTLATVIRTFRRMGHPATLARDPEVDAVLRWYSMLMRHTRTHANDPALFGRIRFRDALQPAELARLTMPVSFFWGATDTFGDAAVARDLVAMLPNARLEVLPESGHLPWLDAPERAAAHVRSALAM